MFPISFVHLRVNIVVNVKIDDIADILINLDKFNRHSIAQNYRLRNRYVIYIEI